MDNNNHFTLKVTSNKIIGEAGTNQMLVFGEKEKPQNLEQSLEPSNSTHTCRQVRESHPVYYANTAPDEKMVTVVV